MNLVRPYPTTSPINVDDSLGAISLFTATQHPPPRCPHPGLRIHALRLCFCL